jgi:hypothetical protein
VPSFGCRAKKTHVIGIGPICMDQVTSNSPYF